jgi:hypothetical protein
MSAQEPPEGGPVAVMLGKPHPLWDGLRVKRESMQSVLTESGFLLLLIFDPLSEAEAASMRKAQYRFGVIKIRGGFSWLLDTPLGQFDQPYTPGLASPDRRELDEEDLLDNRLLRMALSVHTLDARGIVRALRFMTVSPQFSRTLARYHREGLREWTGAAAWNEEIKRFYARYPTPGAAMRDAVMSKGGD